jgi:hypothetical protein
LRDDEIDGCVSSHDSLRTHLTVEYRILHDWENRGADRVPHLNSE